MEKKSLRILSKNAWAFIVLSGCLFFGELSFSTTIMIDPGHGGKDFGAKGHFYHRGKKKRVYEKRVALELSKKIKKQIKRKFPNFKVHLTREDDSFVSLQDRGKMAKALKSDLFLSIHANSSNNKKYQGFETYVLNTANSEYEKHLEKRENSWQVSSDTVNHIVSDFIIHQHVDASAGFARVVEKSVPKTLRRFGYAVRDRGIKQALFSVLFHAQTPGILVEAGFLSSPKEALYLQNSHYQTAWASGLADAVGKWFKQKKYLTPKKKYMKKPRVRSKQQVLSFSTKQK